MGHFVYSHSCGFIPQDLTSNKVFNDNIVITSTAFEADGKEFVNTLEWKNYPFFGTQFHPEKSIYIRMQNYVISRDKYTS